MLLLSLIVLILFLFILLSLLRLTITINLMHAENDDSLSIRVTALFGIIRYTFTMPLLSFSEEEASVDVESEGSLNNNTVEKANNKISLKTLFKNMEEFQLKIKQIADFHSIVRRFLNHITVHQLHWQTAFGLGDAAATGTAAGIVWTIKGGIVTFVSTYMRLKDEPLLEVRPIFQGVTSFTHLECMISFRLGHAMGAALKIVRSMRT
ncbi:DUF2953 domain-containing protein [Pseudalkalibacillus caeni]|uniref:DUF2953 domain-containing protein n=1 Tax=Exobacillus caeni TaxID=2574798 RepID=A0A5R9FA68_9BACL|nr:DUF2953 domain-containing protein [Pseudalkalibacillus caeni]TLS39106.1 DUF2953 domain-containing protein [Pseudalkalibacillus caeni]